MKRLVVAACFASALFGLVQLFSTPVAEAAKGSCANVRCAACPDGYRLSLKWPNCCQCVPI